MCGCEGVVAPLNDPSHRWHQQAIVPYERRGRSQPGKSVECRGAEIGGNADRVRCTPVDATHAEICGHSRKQSKFELTDYDDMLCRSHAEWMRCTRSEAANSYVEEFPETRLM